MYSRLKENMNDSKKLQLLSTKFVIKKCQTNKGTDVCGQFPVSR